MSRRYTFQCPAKIEGITDWDGTPYELNSNRSRAFEINETIMQDDFFSENQAMYVTDWAPDILEDVRYGVVYEDFQLQGVAYVRASRDLTADELEELIGGIAGQFSDGWGESFEQTEIHGETPYDEYFCSFWNSSNSWNLRLTETV